MLNIDRILRQDRLIRATTGLNRKAFEDLLVKFTEVYLSWPQKREKPRKRKPGGGRQARLTTMAEKLFYILFYFKCYPTFDLAAVLFEFDRSQACSMDASATTNFREDFRRKKSAAITQAEQY